MEKWKLPYYDRDILGSYRDTGKENGKHIIIGYIEVILNACADSLGSAGLRVYN